MRTYLVTGGAGFIGSNYIHYMFRKYGDTIRIINVDCLTYAGNLENLEKTARLDIVEDWVADNCKQVKSTSSDSSKSGSNSTGSTGSTESTK